MTNEELLKMAEEFEFEHFAVLDPKTLEFRQDVRDMCNPQSCPNYAKRWSCPPAVADLPELNEKLKNYSRGLIVQTVRPRLSRMEMLVTSSRATVGIFFAFSRMRSKMTMVLLIL